MGIIGGAMYSQYRCVPANQALPLPDATTPADVASWFVNPLTSLGMVETMRPEGISVYGKQATGEKYLINLNKGLA